ncbi:MAG: 16S rRNA (cytosine(967)-C(5))-methyltransferase RsmB [Clostridia bacterium]|nr:16S rRNA (cytosine(967)-C(5))-methyltransferase RsmB [Clostridia bacterium]
MNLRGATLSLLDEYELCGKYVNLSLSSHRLDGLSREERALLTALFYTAVENKLTYDYYISAAAKRPTREIDIHTLNLLRLGCAQILGMDKIPDHTAVNETVKLGSNKGERGFVNAVLRTLIRWRDANSLPLPERERNPARHLSVKYSFPVAIVRHFISLYGEADAEALLRTFNTEKYTDLTVNTLKADREALLSRLCAEGISAAKSPYSQYSLRLFGSYSPTLLHGFTEGEFFVQDASCAVSAEVLSPVSGEEILDLCAAPGGKSFAAAVISRDGAKILSLDLHESKLSLISDGAARLGLRSVSVEQNDATLPRVEFFDKFDRIICDVPCSGLGVLGKKADLRYNAEGAMEHLPQLQYKILSVAAKYLKRGGTLVYSTCTLNPNENESNVRRFLAEESDFSTEDFSVGELRSADGMLTLLPHIHHTDGFFIAKLVKKP